jgi:hypothetical protein
MNQVVSVDIFLEYLQKALDHYTEYFNTSVEKKPQLNTEEKDRTKNLQTFVNKIKHESFVQGQISVLEDIIKTIKEQKDKK